MIPTLPGIFFSNMTPRSDAQILLNPWSSADYAVISVPVSRSPFSFPRSPFLVHRFPFTLFRSPFLVLCSEFSVSCSPFSVPRSPFSVLRSPFSAPRSPFSVLRSSFSVPRSKFTVPNSSFLDHRCPFFVPRWSNILLLLWHNSGRFKQRFLKHLSTMGAFLMLRFNLDQKKF